MARYSFLNTNSSLTRVPCTLGSCSEGDLVSLPILEIDLAIITDAGCHPGCTGIVSLEEGTIIELSSLTPCRKYTGILQVNTEFFEDFV